jgi:hypothetical protein
MCSSISFATVVLNLQQMDIPTNEVCKVWQIYLEKNVDMPKIGVRCALFQSSATALFSLDINFLKDFYFPSTHAV